MLPLAIFDIIISFLRFGDQILQVNGQNVAGFSSDKVNALKLSKNETHSIRVGMKSSIYPR